MHCNGCDTHIEGDYNLPVMMQLSAPDQQFVLDFVKSSGSLKEMAQKLGLSYPTVRNRLDDIIAQLNLILPGITLKHLLMLAEKNGIPTSEAPFTMQELADADEIIVSSSGGLCIQAVELDGKPIGGKDPKTLKTLQDAYAEFYAEDTKVR